MLGLRYRGSENKVPNAKSGTSRGCITQILITVSSYRLWNPLRCHVWSVNRDGLYNNSNQLKALNF